MAVQTTFKEELAAGLPSVTTQPAREFAVAALLFAVLLAAPLALILKVTDGRLVYAQDDAYIHMALANNLAHNNVWGATPHEFAPASSSPLWTLLLAAVFRAIGVHESLPLVLNVLCAFGAFCLGWLVLVHAGFSFRWRLALLALFVLVTPLPAVIYTGMEHSLHLCLALAFLLLAGEVMGAQHQGRRGFILLCGLAILAVGTRYESMFMICGAVLLLVLKRRFLQGALLFAAGALPVLAFGVYFTSNGGLFLPNPVLLKGLSPDVSSLAGFAAYVWDVWYQHFYGSPHTLLLLIAALMLLVANREEHRRTITNPVLWLLAFTMCCHLSFARSTSAFGRYESYLIGSAIILLPAALGPHRVARFMNYLRARFACQPGMLTVIMALLLVVAGTPYLFRGLGYYARIPLASNSIFLQHHQMARFFSEYYPGGSVAINDIGAVAHMADVRLLDLVGLASTDVTRHRRNGTFDRERIQAMAEQHGVQVAAIYDHWFRDMVPTTWEKVAVMKTPSVAVSGGEVSFYAISGHEAARLRRNIEDFMPSLPRGTRISLNPPAPQSSS